MKKALIILLALILCTTCVFFLAACDKEKPVYETEDIKYDLSDDKSYYTVTYVGNTESGIIEIPEKIDGIPVTKIGKDAFNVEKSKANIKEVTLPKTITEISEDAFGGCTTLVKVTLPNGLKAIRKGAFAGCGNIEDIIIPSTVEFVSKDAFTGCDKLVETVDDIEYVDNWALRKTKKSLKNLKFRFETVGISDGFSTSDKAHITLPVAVRHIHSTFIYLDPDCLTTHPNGMVYLGNWLYSTSNVEYGAVLDLLSYTIGVLPTAFSEYSSAVRIHFSEVNIPKEVVTMYSFPNSSGKITVDEDNPYFKSINGVLFTKDEKTLLCMPNGTSRSTYTVPDTVTKIGKYAFFQNHIDSITLPSSLEEIGAYAFSESRIKSIKIPESVTEIKENAFKGCRFLESVTLPSRLVTIDDTAFDGCNLLDPKPHIN